VIARLRRRWRDRAATWRITIADRGERHPRHVVLAVITIGLLLGPRVPASVIAVIALAVAFGALTLPLVRLPATAVALAAVLIAAAWVGAQRSAALDRTHLTADFGHAAIGEATLLTPPRADAYGGHRMLMRWRGEPVLLRVPSWSRAAGEGGRPTGAADLQVGDIVAVRGTLRQPDLAGRSVHAHATLRATGVTATGRRRGGWLGMVDGVRRRAERVLDGHLPPAEAALLRGMVLGDDAALPDDLRDAFKAAGLTHLTAASGQNILLLAALALGLGMVAGLGIRARWALVLVLIIMYVPLAGGGPSIQRAGIMGAATILACLAGRPASRWYAVLLAAALTLALDPRSAGDAGWQLSFVAVIGIAAIAAPARERLHARGLPAPVAEAVAVTLAATLATAPLIAVRFDQTSLVALPANILATPAVAPIMWLGMAAGALGQLAPSVATPLVALAGPPLGYLAGLARLAAGLPGAQLALPLTAVIVLSALAAVLATAAPDGPDAHLAPEPLRAFERGSRPRRLMMGAAVVVAVLAALGPALIPSPTLAPPPDGDLRVTALDIGQGDATLLQAGGHAVLVDAGPPGAGVVARLRAAGVQRLDALVVTHPQADHDGGAPAVLSALPVRILLDGRAGDRSATSIAIDGPVRHADTRVVAAQAGQILRAGPLSLRILWPPADPAAPGTDPNDRAIVAVARAYGASTLLTADAESNVLAALDLPAVDVLKVSHHGSADPGLPALLQRLRPRVALIEVGAHNTYGHPTPATMHALTATVPVIARTDQDGTVRVDLSVGGATVTRAGEARR
jgi:competence protein ComEC